MTTLRPLDGDTAPPLTPIRWQEVEGDSPSRTPVHRTSNLAGLTICGERVPAGAWSGDDVEEGARDRSPCPGCWEAS